MQDRSIKFLLTGIALLLLGVLVRPLWQSAPVQAQAIPVNSAPPLMLMDKDDSSMYVMQNGRVYVYTRENDGNLHWILWQVLNPAQDVPKRLK